MDPLIVIIKDEAITVTLLECLYKCIENDTSWKQPSDWNKIDDILEEILKRIAFENDNRCISNLFLFVAKLTSLPIKDNDVLQKEIKFSVIDKTSEKNADAIVNNFDNLRDVCRIYDNLLIYRWIKKLFQLFGHQTFLGRTEDTRIQLHVNDYYFYFTLSKFCINPTSFFFSFTILGCSCLLSDLHLRNPSKATKHQMD